ncbi:hypothetical protein [Endozoicomonas sp. GU-1]|uniref:hypothetical protein n=1 Tax=Endozoicomonas sp. GU-1 TaxID=3009078 RepID=UPI0022B55A39|nr:hypothetical protein [Endozoicomonas sp. GU-1]WBA81921.1 hypothetical protein O2T12_01760 [Endozoicomonas sp. GU-1]WBA84872.1 hypothetical protein O3276_16545 [Endozoicomonas sp. GU-1]
MAGQGSVIGLGRDRGETAILLVEPFFEFASGYWTKARLPWQEPATPWMKLPFVV